MMSNKVMALKKIFMANHAFPVKSFTLFLIC